MTSESMRRWMGAPVRDDPAFLEWFVRFRQAGASPAARIALSRMNAMIDVRDILPSIRVPTWWQGPASLLRTMACIC